MFINIIEFPPVMGGKDGEFWEWFSWSNSVYRKFEGFICRRLLKPARGKKNYAAIKGGYCIIHVDAAGIP